MVNFEFFVTLQLVSNNYSCCDWQVERPRIEKKQVTSEHPVIKRKKKKYKDPDNLCKNMRTNHRCWVLFLLSFLLPVVVREILCGDKTKPLQCTCKSDLKCLFSNNIFVIKHFIMLVIKFGLRGKVLIYRTAIGSTNCYCYCYCYYY